MMGFLTYIRLKVVVLLLRLLARLVSGPTQCFPDRVLHISSRQAGRKIKVHVYESRDNDSKPRPVLLNLYGSGFILPFHGSDDEFCARVVQETEYTVLDVQYRLAPENPFPAALEDVEDVANWILQKPEDFDLTRLAISGFSAGGNLALATASGVCDKGTFSSVLAFYPSTNKSLDPGDRRAPDTSVEAGSVALSRLFDECYIKSGMDKKNPLISPSFAPAQVFSHNVLVITAAQDNLCLEAEALAAKIKDADESRNVVTMRMEKCGHAWDKSAKPRTLQEKAKNEAYAFAMKMLQLD
jgi:acetyl esterase/lipase